MSLSYISIGEQKIYISNVLADWIHEKLKKIKDNHKLEFDGGGDMRKSVISFDEKMSWWR